MDCLISLLFLERYSIIGIVNATTPLNNNAPAIAGTPVTTAAVKNTEVTNKFPISMVIFFAALAPSLTIFLFSASFLDISNILFVINSNFSIPFSAAFLGNLKLKQITKLFEKSKQNLNIEEKELNNIIKLINFHQSTIYLIFQ